MKLSVDDLIGLELRERSLSLAEFASLPWPSDEQVNAFVEHVCDAHSWYKHLRLREGGEFDFFMARDAGNGYTAESPRLHHTWKTTDEYRRRFGFLDYCCSSWRDAGAPLIRPREIFEATRIVLFPYVCRSGDSEACLWGPHEEGVAYLIANGAHTPADERAWRWYQSEKGIKSLPPLTDEESEQLELLLEDAEYADIDADPLPQAIAEHVRATKHAISVYREIQEQEEAKIVGALTRLRALHARLNGNGAVAE